MLCRVVAYFLSVSAILADIATAAGAKYEPDYNMNLRETCRKKVAGYYLSMYDDSVRLQGYLEMLAKKEAKLNAAYLELENRNNELQKKLKEFYFDLDVLYQDENLRARRRQLDWAQQLNRDLRTRYVPDAAKLARDVADLRARILTVFQFVPIQGSGIGYPFRLDFQQECPKYRFNCPLSRKYASLLVKIMPKEDLPTACYRYADFLR